MEENIEVEITIGTLIPWEHKLFQNEKDISLEILKKG